MQSQNKKFNFFTEQVMQGKSIDFHIKSKFWMNPVNSQLQHQSIFIRWQLRLMGIVVLKATHRKKN